MATKKIAAKIRKVMKDDPNLTRVQALGKAFGILRSEGVKVRKKRRKKK